jgi:hypothetical protein
MPKRVIDFEYHLTPKGKEEIQEYADLGGWDGYNDEYGDDKTNDISDLITAIGDGYILGFEEMISYAEDFQDIEGWDLSATDKFIKHKLNSWIIEGWIIKIK